MWVTPTDTHLGWGKMDDPLNDPARWLALRAIVDGLSEDFDIIQIDLPVWLERIGLPGPDARPDGVHLADGLDARFVVDEVAPTLTKVAGSIASDIER